MQPSSTDQVVLRVLSGDIDAYAEIVRAHQRDVWRVVGAMLLDTQQSEDLVQRTFIQAYQQLHRFQPGHDFGPWIKEIARNTVRQETRRRQREGKRVDLYHNHWLTLLEAGENSDHDGCLEAALEDCIGQLPKASAQVLALRYQQAMDFGEIASQIGRTVEAARQHLARIRLALRDCIEKRLTQP